MKKETIGAEEIYLAPPTELYDRAREIARTTAEEEKYPFVLQYDVEQKSFLQSILQMLGAVTETTETEKKNLCYTQMNMTQFSFVKALDCIERVRTEETETNAALSQMKAARAKAIKQTEALTQSASAMALDAEPSAAAAAMTRCITDPSADTTNSSCSDCTCTCGTNGSCSCCPSNRDMASAQEISWEYVNGCICCPGAEQWFKFTPAQSVRHTIRTTGTLDTIGYLYDCCGCLIAFNNDDYRDKVNFRMVEQLTAGQTYYIRVGAYKNQTGSYTLQVTTKIFPQYTVVEGDPVTLIKDVLYELPLTPDYTYRGYNGARPIPGLSVFIYPLDAEGQDLWWWDQYGSGLECYYGSDHEGNRYIHVKATKEGSAKLYVEDLKEQGARAVCEVWVKGKTPVFLIHGRTSNSAEYWGARNKIFSNPLELTDRDNNHFNPNVDAVSIGTPSYQYVSKTTQDICSSVCSSPIKVNGKEVENFELDGIFNGEMKDGKYSEVHPEGGNLAYHLKNCGYQENINLFAFNYPNEDAVVYDAQKFEKYIENLIDYVRTQGSDEMKACFYGSQSAYNKNEYRFNIVAHSMGGLVSRYYIENLGHHDHVEKLITICTPHWGTGGSNLSSNTGLIHVLCDHDLDTDSKMFGGTNSVQLNYPVPSVHCCNEPYTLTDELQYRNTRSTKYYAIAGVTIETVGVGSGTYPYELPSNYTKFDEIEAFFNEKELPFNIKNQGDNLVGFLSQIGWTEEGGDSPSKRISMEKIWVHVDAWKNNGILMPLHKKMPHRENVMEKVYDYLRE